jgi:CheY-like chemotaxis protein
MKTLEPVKHIICVDDNEGEYRLMKSMFKELLPHVSVSWFYNGQRFVEFLKANPKDFSTSFVIMDVSMPGGGAKEILTQMQADGLIGKLPVLVTSCIERYDDKQFFSQFPKVFFRVKPEGLSGYEDLIAVLEKNILLAS